MNATLDLRGATATDDGNRFWDCHTGVKAQSVYMFLVQYNLFRSTHSVGTALFPFPVPGDYGIQNETNRFSFEVHQSEFNNLKYGIHFSTPLTTQPYDMTGTATLSGVYADHIHFSQNYFGPEVLSLTPYSSSSPNTSEYFSDAIVLSTPNTASWTVGGPTSYINSNRMDRVFRGVTIEGMDISPLTVTSNSMLIEDDYTFGPIPTVPAF